MRSMLYSLGFAALVVTGTHAANARVADHLKCYKVKDPQTRASYTADLGGLVAEPECKIIVPSVMACVPSTKTNVTPTPPGAGGTGTPNSFFCYKVKCPNVTLPALNGTDQFGSRTVRPSTAKLLCAPLAGPSTTTSTTTTTTSSTTNTTLRFVDNGDGTVTDHQTGLQWEKKDNTCPGIHCVNDIYAWSNSGTVPDGGAFTSFLSTLNNCTSPDGLAVTSAFAGHCDWRLPTIAELLTIVEPFPACMTTPPCIDPIFGSFNAVEYWSSTTLAGSPTKAWSLSFYFGSRDFHDKTVPFTVRAVRGGS